ncbi:uncharacterized protein EDB91DRAFT_324325 [Suillus paluster]|uniref:uncharacterized protein n=1 Tax=Suillus paluster TaxID=48578 RepID=UPI001B87D9A6|nr:uncharacterized protein EDB91DRAFT_324325 [Suillus paluster]KAG1720684.1 hypothetical protein EDB91DRAFT_324325 [Suillus paluster]
MVGSWRSPITLALLPYPSVDPRQHKDLFAGPTEVIDVLDANNLLSKTVKSNSVHDPLFPSTTPTENGSFSHGNQPPAVHFKVPRGGRIALVGESGASEGTTIRLLYWF